MRESRTPDFIESAAACGNTPPRALFGRSAQRHSIGETNMTAVWYRTGALACAMGMGFAPGAALGADAGGVLKRAAAAMGSGDLKSIRYAGSGSAWSFGQAYEPGKAWPKLNLSSYARTVDYQAGAFREDLVRSRAEPSGGGLVPLAGDQRLSQYLSGTHAWNQIGPAPTPARSAVAGRIHELWITPHGVIMAAQKSGAQVQFRTEQRKEVAAVSFSQPGQFSATAILDENYLVVRVESRVPHPVTGDTATVTTYEDYRQFAGVAFPTRIRQTQGGFPVLDVAVTDVQPNAAAAGMDVPAPVSAASERVTVEKAAEGVWYLAGGSHHSVAIEMKDYLIVVESPLYDARASLMLFEAKRLAPGKPIRYLVNSHPHYDHAGGLRTAAAEGATLVVHAKAKAHFDKVLANPNRIDPDLLAKSGKRAKTLGVGAKHVISDSSRTVEVHPITQSIHSTAFLMVYLPKEKLLIEADAYTPLAPNAAPPTPANANNVNLADNIERLGLEVDRILPLHGRIVPLAELYRTIGRVR